MIATVLLSVSIPVASSSEDPGYTILLADGSEIAYTCMEPVAGAASLTAPKMRFVFIRFPQANEGGYESYPDWADPADSPSWLEREVGQYFTAMSVGMQQPDVAIVTDPTNPGRPWSGDFAADYYITNGGASELHHEIFLKIHNAYLSQFPNGYWQGVNYIFVVAYDQAYDPSYSLGGFRGLGAGYNLGIPNLNAEGFTSHLFVRIDRTPVRDAFDTPQNQSSPGVFAHEYGHVLGMWHPPYSGNYQYRRGSGRDLRSGACAPAGEPPRYHLAPCARCGHAGEPACSDPIYINVGRYDVMRGILVPGPPERVGPYHAIQLFETTPWLGVDTLRANALDFHVPQLRHPDPAKRKVFVIEPGLSSEYFDQVFLISNHQGDPASPILQFDANYQGRGLLIWHLLGDRVWDLESAAGEVSDIHLGQPFDPLWPIDPPHRGDALARSWTFPGSAGDFYSDAYGVTNFSSATNPNSNFYAEDFDFWSPQTVVSHVGIENIRQDASSDMIVDIYVDPTQYVTYPNGGEYHPSGKDLVVTWRLRPEGVSGIDRVDLGLSLDGGQTWNPGLYLLNQPNTGSCTYPGLGCYSDQMRVRVVSYDGPVSHATDVSNANFIIWDILEPSVVPVVTTFCKDGSPVVKLDVSWQTTVSTDAGQDKLEVYFPSHQNPCGANPSSTKTGGSGGTSHQLVWQGTCQTGGFRYHMKSKKGTGETVSECGAFLITACPDCPPCPPPCEIE